MNDDHNTAEDDVQTLIAQLRSPSAAARLHAAEELGRLGDARAVQPLLQAICGKRDVALRTAGIQALGKIGTPATDHLKQVLSDRQRWGADIRIEAASLLGILGDAHAVPTLAAALSDPVQSVATKSAWSLGMIGTPDAHAHLLEMLHHSIAQRRQYAADALAKFGDASAIAGLIQMLHAPYDSSRFSAARALGCIAQRCPSLALRSALPRLQQLQNGRFTQWPYAVYKDTIAQIRAATDAVQDLPRPASAPPVSAEKLPVPASTPLPQSDSLPLPAAAPATVSDTVPHHSSFLEKMRSVLHRDGHERSS